LYLISYHILASSKGKEHKKMSDVILETRNLTKKYRNQVALDNASITLKKNHIYGFIGENGAGKSTFMKLIAGLTFPTSGDMTLMGETEKGAIENKRKLVGTMIEGPYLYPNYSVRQNVEIQRILVGNPKFLILYEPIHSLDALIAGGYVTKPELLHLSYGKNYNPFNQSRH
jgi:ABC-type multidrug transport system ATPase subunit